MEKTGGDDMVSETKRSYSAGKSPAKRRGSVGEKGKPVSMRVDPAAAVGEVPQSDLEEQSYKDEVDDQDYARFIRENGI